MGRWLGTNTKEIVAADESGMITRHYGDCVNCGAKGTMKVYECNFASWKQVEKSCSICLFLERKVQNRDSVMRYTPNPQFLEICAIQGTKRVNGGSQEDIPGPDHRGSRVGLYAHSKKSGAKGTP